MATFNGGYVAVLISRLRKSIGGRAKADAVGRSLVIPFLNGIEHVDFLRSVFLPSSVVPATIRVETARVRPGLTRQTSPFASIEMEATEDNRDRVESIAAHLSGAGLDVRVRDDELAMLWDKFAFLAPMALLTTHERANVGAIRTRRRADAIALIGEVAAVAKADGVAIDPGAVLHLLDTVPESMESSMQRDQAAGRQLELEALGGALLRRVDKAGVDVHVTRRLVDELQARSKPAVSTGSES